MSRSYTSSLQTVSMACSGTAFLCFTSKRTPHFTITKNNWLMLFKEIIAVYSENTEPINTLCGHNPETVVKAGGAYSYHWAAMY
jgi:hypothetical protein